MNVAVPYEGQTVVSLLFDATRAPYAIRASNGDIRVPWRSGNSTRCAHRSDLISVPLPVVAAPRFEVLRATVGLDAELGRPVNMNVHADVYVYPRTRERVAIAFHDCSGSAESLNSPHVTELPLIEIEPEHEVRLSFILTAGRSRHASHTRSLARRPKC